MYHHHHIRFWYLRCCGCPGLRVGNTWQRLTLILHEFLSNGLTPSRLHIVISFLTHADHVFLGLPQSLVPGSSNHVMELMHEVARCMCLYHLRRRVRRTAVISSRSSFWGSTAEGISSASFAPQIHLIMVRSFLRSRCRSEAFGAQVSLPWSIVDRTQAVNTLSHLEDLIKSCTVGCSSPRILPWKICGLKPQVTVFFFIWVHTMFRALFNGHFRSFEVWKSVFNIACIYSSPACQWNLMCIWLILIVQIWSNFHCCLYRDTETQEPTRWEADRASEDDVRTTHKTPLDGRYK